MGTTTSQLLWTLLQPGNLLLLLLALGVVLLWGRRRVWGRGLVGLVLLALALTAVLPLGSWLMAPLEDHFPAPRTLPEQVQGVILLGGASQPAISAARGQPALNGNAERHLGFVALARRYPEARLAFSGGGGAPGAGAPTEAMVTRQVLLDLGLDVGRVSFDDQARNTFENARNLLALLAPEANETWVLVTSARHMPRAVGVFRKAGWRVLPYPVDYTGPGGFAFRLGFNLTGGMSALTTAAKEWTALVSYYLMGRTSALFPSADEAR
jgi:uncharacterized SAM-binding protein YcdF (DUF218 family)